MLDVLEGNRTYWNEDPKCEPQPGGRRLYRLMGGDALVAHGLFEGERTVNQTMAPLTRGALDLFLSTDGHILWTQSR